MQNRIFDLAIVRAPHQILYSAERLVNSDLKKVIILDMPYKQNFNNTIDRILDKTEWDKIIKLNYQTNDPGGIFKFLFYLLILKIFCIFKIKIRNLIIGDGSIVFAKLLSDNFKYINKRIVIGDGTDFLGRNGSSKQIRYYCQVGEKTKKLIKLFNFKFNSEYQYDELFTYFQVDDTRLNINKFFYVKRLIERKSSFIDEKNIYFLGTVGLNFEDIERIYRKIFSYYPEMLIKYIPHRRETKEQIEIIRLIGSVTVIDTKGEIVETYFMSNNIIPVNLGSFISNAVFSLAAIYPHLNIDVYKVKFGDENRCHWNEIKFREMISKEIMTEQVKYRSIDL